MVLIYRIRYQNIKGSLQTGNVDYHNSQSRLKQDKIRQQSSLGTDLCSLLPDLHISYEFVKIDVDVASRICENRRQLHDFVIINSVNLNTDRLNPLKDWVKI